MTERCLNEINTIGPLKPDATKDEATAWVRAMDKTSGGPFHWDDTYNGDLPIGCPAWVADSAKIAGQAIGDIWDAVESNWEAED